MGKVEKLDFRVKSTTWVAVVSSSWAEVVYRKKNIHARIMLAKDNIGNIFCAVLIRLTRSINLPKQFSNLDG